MSRLRFAEAYVAHRFTFVQYRAEDGVEGREFDNVVVRTADGREWALPVVEWRSCEETGLRYPHALYDAESRLAEVRNVGSINPGLWVEIPPYDRVDEEAYNLRCEDEDRLAWGGV